jgi:hypothetical protein
MPTECSAESFDSRKPYYTTGNERLNAWPNRTDPIPADVLQMRRPNAGGISDTWGESAGRSAGDEVVVQVPSLQGCHRGYDQAKNQMKAARAQVAAGEWLSGHGILRVISRRKNRRPSLGSSHRTPSNHLPRRSTPPR